MDYKETVILTGRVEKHQDMEHQVSQELEENTIWSFVLALETGMANVFYVLIPQGLKFIISSLG